MPSYLLRCLLLLSISLPTLLPAQTTHPPRRTKLPPELKEASGMVRTTSGEVWMLNDSRNPPILFRYDPLAGQIKESRLLPVPNRDWEDITTDPQGFLYIGDVGNNRNARRDLRVYRYHPVTGQLDSILLRYPDQHQFAPADTRWWNFNCEAMVWHHDSLHLFSKNSFQGNFYTKHYVVPARPGEYVAELRDSICLKNRVVTGAAISRDGHTLALTGYIIGKKMGFLPSTKASVFYFTDFAGSSFFQGKAVRKRLPKFLIARQFESVTQWEGDCWLVANEGRKPQHQAVWGLKGCRKL